MLYLSVKVVVLGRRYVLVYFLFLSMKCFSLDFITVEFSFLPLIKKKQNGALTVQRVRQVNRLGNHYTDCYNYNLIKPFDRKKQAYNLYMNELVQTNRPSDETFLVFYCASALRTSRIRHYRYQPVIY